MGVPDILIDIIWPFHDNMNASIRVDGELLEEIEVNNGLRGMQHGPNSVQLVRVYGW